MSSDPKNKSEPQSPLASGFDPAAAFTAMFSQWMEQSARGTRALLGTTQSSADPPQAVSGLWLEAVARGLDDVVRSPAFAELVGRHLKTMAERSTLTDQAAQGATRADDFAGLHERLRGTEQTLLKRLQSIEDRLRALEARSKG